jgi:hypothetical protein
MKQPVYLFQHHPFPQLPEGKQALNMGEFFNIMAAITQAARITCLDTSKAILDGIEKRVNLLSEKQRRVLKAIASHKKDYISDVLGVDLPEDVLMGMANYSTLEIIREMLSCAKSDHMIRRSLYHNTPLAAKVKAV